MEVYLSLQPVSKTGPKGTNTHTYIQYTVPSVWLVQFEGPSALNFNRITIEVFCVQQLFIQSATFKYTHYVFLDDIDFISTSGM